MVYERSTVEEHRLGLQPEEESWKVLLSHVGDRRVAEALRRLENAVTAWASWSVQAQSGVSVRDFHALAALFDKPVGR